MQKNWYAAYTKPDREKIVSHLISKKGIENFCPFNYRTTQPFLQTKVLYEPLFKSYVFLRTTEHGLINLREQTSYILSFLYWTNKPAIISADEINAIKSFSEHYREIKLEKIVVGIDSSRDDHETISYATEGNVLKKISRIIKVNLPSLGFAMVANTNDAKIRNREIFLINKNLPLHPQS